MLAAAYINVCRHSSTHRAILKCFTVSGCARHLSTTREFDPTIREFVSRLAKKQPSFRVASKDVRVLSQPSEFYTNLLVSTRVLSFCDFPTVGVLEHHPSCTAPDFSVVFIHWVLGDRTGGYIVRYAGKRVFLTVTR
jgi:hypothetical protein